MLMLLMLCFYHVFFPCHAVISKQVFNSLMTDYHYFLYCYMWIEKSMNKIRWHPFSYVVSSPVSSNQASCLFLLTCAICEDHDKLTWGWSTGLHNWLVPSQQPWRTVAFVLPTMSWWHPSCHLVQAFSYPKNVKSLGPSRVTAGTQTWSCGRGFSVGSNGSVA